MKTVIRRICIMLVSLFLLAGPCLARAGVGAPGQMTVAKALMCEGVEQSAPVNQAAVFSIEIGKVSCFTELDHVQQQTVVYHKWYRKDNLVAVKRLWINPDRRVTYTSMQLRNADKGPWRVDVTDAGNNLLATLRFSITE